MIKVAQGWVLSWAPPRRPPGPSSSFEGGHAEAIQQTAINNSLQQQQQPSDETGALLDLSKSLKEPQQQFVYTLEVREKNSTDWQTYAVTRDQSLLLKELRVGGDYQFRVIARTASGLRGVPSAEYRYYIPDNKRKPGITQAFSATVTSGLLFFIACIVIAVCGVNMCNKRRKKRAEKGLYHSVDVCDCADSPNANVSRPPPSHSPEPSLIEIQSPTLQINSRHDQPPTS